MNTLSLRVVVEISRPQTVGRIWNRLDTRVVCRLSAGVQSARCSGSLVDAWTELAAFLT